MSILNHDTAPLGQGHLPSQFSQELAGALQFTMQAALQRYLGDLIELQGVEVSADEAILRVQVNYVVRRTQQQRVAQFSQGGLGS